MKKSIALILVCVLLTGLLASCAQGKAESTSTASNAASSAAPESASSSQASSTSTGSSSETTTDTAGKRVVLLVKKLSSTYWTDLRDAVQKQCDELSWELEVLCPVTDDSNEEQIELLEQSLLNPPDIYLIAPADAVGIAPAIEMINEENIPIICVTNRIAEGCGDYVTYVGVQYFDIAATAAAALVEKMGGTGNILFIEGTTGSSTSNDINAGAKSVFEKASGIKILDSQPANYNRVDAMTVTQNLLQKHSDVDAIFASNGEMAMGAVEAVRQANRQDEIVISALNCSAELVQAVADGSLLFTADDVSWKMGQESVLAANDYFQGQTLPKELMQEAVIVDESVLDDYKLMYDLK
jgi:ribose transport system substrate-binding protein